MNVAHIITIIIIIVQLDICLPFLFLFSSFIAVLHPASSSSSYQKDKQTLLAAAVVHIIANADSTHIPRVHRAHMARILQVFAAAIVEYIIKYIRKE